MKTMFFRVLIVTALIAPAALLAGQMHAGQSSVEISSVKSAIKLQAPVEGFLTALNGTVDMRASEIVFEPGGTIKEHYHFGPGIRHLVAGELTLVDSETGHEQMVHAGEFFYESGTRRHVVVNRGLESAKVVVVELVPAGLKGPAMVAIDRRPELEATGAAMKDKICAAK